MVSQKTKLMSKLIHFEHLVLIKYGFNLRSEAAKNHWSYTWWVLEPVLHMGALYVVFGIFLNRGTEDLNPFLLCGIMPWLWFSKSVANSNQSIIQERGLISQTSTPKVFFPLVIISQNTIKLCRSWCV